MASISNRYAQALFTSAENKEQYKLALENLSNLYKTTQLKDVIKNPRIDKKTKLEILTEIIPNDQVFINFIKLLLKEGRLDILENISSDYTKMLDKQTKTINLKITSAYEINKIDAEEIAKKYQKLYNANNIKYKTAIDKSLIGGIKVEIDGKIYDDTIKTKLNEIL